jgi:aminomethyltransferase
VTEEVPSRLSPLHDFHLERGAKLADFGGWLMPIEYPTTGGHGEGGVLAEHLAVRNRVGIFDVSHLGKISISGVGAATFLNSILTNDLGAIGAMQAQYTLLLDDSGGVIDDMIAYRISDDEVFLIPNASNSQQVFTFIAARAPVEIVVANRHLDYSVIAVQGPRSQELIEAIAIPLPSDLSYMSFARLPFSGEEITICRTGYTGERGYELIAPVVGEYSRQIWDLLVEALAIFDGRVVGLGARDTLRTEMGYALHGHELSLEINPIEAGVGWAVAASKSDFSGRAALVATTAKGVKRKSIALAATDRTIPRTGMSVSFGGEMVGTVTSGTFSPTLKRGIALALIRADLAQEAELGSSFTIDIRGRTGEYEKVKLPFVPSQVR